jgi:hypothetical protein
VSTVHRIRVAVLAAALLALGPRVATGQDFTLTGSWAGSITCKSLDAGVKGTSKVAPVMTVSQVGTEVGVQLDFGGGVVERYTGLANPDGKKPETKGELALIHCGTDDILGGETSFDEIGRLTVATKAPPAVKAALKGTTVTARPESVGTCKWKWTRTGVADPGVSTSCVQ